VQSKNQTFIEAARRAQLVDCAIEAIAELGYVKASMAKIAARAGVSTGVISYHFGSKDELIDEVVKNVIVEATAVIEPLVVGATGAREGLRVLITGNLGYFREHRSAAVALVQIMTHGPAQTYAPQGESAHDDVQKLLQWGQSSGEFRDFNVPVMATMIRSAIDAVAIKASNEPELDVELYASEMADLFDRATRKEQR
jgi:AcrR family transcriptional regulator